MSRKFYTLFSVLLIASFALAACGTPAAHSAAGTCSHPTTGSYGSVSQASHGRMVAYYHHRPG